MASPWTAHSMLTMRSHLVTTRALRPGLVTLVQPVLAGLLGQQVPDLGSAVLAEDVAGVPGSHRLVPVVLRQGTAAPTGHGGAAMLRGAALADAFAVLGPGASGRAGERVALVRLPG